MANKVVSLNHEGGKYSIISSLQEHIEEIGDLIVIIEWKENDKVQLCKTAMTTSDLAWYSAYLNGKVYQDIFKQGEEDG